MPISCGDCKYYEEFMPEEDGYDSGHSGCFCGPMGVTRPPSGAMTYFNDPEPEPENTNRRTP